MVLSIQVAAGSHIKSDIEIHELINPGEGLPPARGAGAHVEFRERYLRKFSVEEGILQCVLVVESYEIMEKPMKASVPIAMLCISTGFSSFANDVPFGAPIFPANDWQLRISIKLNNGFIYEMKGLREPAKGADEIEWEKFRSDKEQAHVDELMREITFEIGRSLYEQSAAEIRGTDNNPLITTNVPDWKLLSPMDEPLHLGFMPVHDQRLTYLAAIHAASEFRFAQETHPYTGITPGVDIGLSVTIHGNSIWVWMQEIDPSQPLTTHMSELLALLERNLPKRYWPLFDIFQLPHLTEIPEVAKADFGTCPLHDVLLVPGTVKKGAEGWSERYLEIEKMLFPEANTYIDTGWCATGQDFSRVHHLLYCPNCRESREAWMKSVTDLNAYRDDWARENDQVDRNEAIDGDKD